MKPVVEHLEDRPALSTVTCVNHVLTITGDSANNDVTVSVTDVGYTQPKVIVDVDAIHKVYNLSNVQAINVTLNGGGDWFVYANNPGDEFNDYFPVDDSHVTVSVNGSGGDDGLVILGGSAKYVMSGNSGDDVIDCGGTTGGATLKGGAGDDILIGSDGNDSLLGGDGWDQIDCGDGNDTVDGGAGSNDIYAKDYLGVGDADVIYKHATDTVFADPEDTITLV